MGAIPTSSRARETAEEKCKERLLGPECVGVGGHSPAAHHLQADQKSDREVTLDGERRVEPGEAESWATGVVRERRGSED